jgi:hypothetical protein
MSIKANKYGPISLSMHAINDLIGLVFLLFSPWLLGFNEYTDATNYTVVLFIIGMSLNIVTDYPLGIFKKLPFKWHKLVEFASPPLFIVIPWYFYPDAGNMPWVASIIGVLVLINAWFTKPIRS